MTEPDAPDAAAAAAEPPPPDAPGDDLPRVAASERDLIMMARSLVAPHHRDGWAMPRQMRALPPAVGPTAARLIGDALAHAWVALWRRGGTAPGASLDEDKPDSVRRGRLWQRHPPTPFAFTAASMMLLRWLLATPPSSARNSFPPLRAMPLTLGDQVVLYLALDSLAGSPAQDALAGEPFTAGSPLAWLGFARQLARSEAALPDAAMFAPLTTGAGAVAVESIAPELAARWRAAELDKRGLASIERLLAIGRAQDATLTAFMAACDAAHRRDLALFVVDAIAPLLARNLAPIPPPLDPTASLSARTTARVAAGALVRALLRWREWDAQHRAIRFVDDGYPAAQLLLARYEVVGSAGGDRAEAWLAELSQLVPSATVTDPREPA